MLGVFDEQRRWRECSGEQIERLFCPDPLDDHSMRMALTMAASIPAGINLISESAFSAEAEINNRYVKYIAPRAIVNL